MVLSRAATAAPGCVRCHPARLEVRRERVAAVMTADEIHEDVHRFFAKLVAMAQDHP